MKIKNFIDNNGLKEKVFLHGYYKIDYMPYFLKKADMLFLCLKDKEIFKKTTHAKLQAYMACSKPISAMISGESNNILKSYNSGFVVNSGEYQKFANKLIKFSKFQSQQKKNRH